MSARRVQPVDEVTCRLEVDGRTLRTFHCTPERYAELALGWLIGEGTIDPAAAAAARLVLRWDEQDAVVRFATDPAASRPDPSPPDPSPPQDGAAIATVIPPTDFTHHFRELYARAERYHQAGGIHAAAVFEGDRLIAHAEDVGRHNAVDKAIGQAALAAAAGEPRGLVVTARVSGEMARKATRARMAWVASRSVPTTLALAVAGRAGMSIVARAPSAEARVFVPERRPLGVILAGGRNRRFDGRPKALERVDGRRIVDRVTDALRPLCADVVMIANDAGTYADVDLPMRPDARTGAGPVGGVREALAWARERGLPGALVVACDMPFVPVALLDALWRASAGADGAVPESGGPRGVEPLCAAYRVSCLDAIERALERDDLRVIGFFSDADVRRLSADEIAACGDAGRIFFNVNTADELARARAMRDGPADGGAVGGGTAGDGAAIEART